MSKINPDNETIIWSNRAPDRRKLNRRSLQDRRFSGEARALKVPDLREGAVRRQQERRKKVKLIITGRALETSTAKKS